MRNSLNSKKSLKNQQYCKKCYSKPANSAVFIEATPRAPYIPYWLFFGRNTLEIIKNKGTLNVKFACCSCMHN
jgi:hypothetical protein